MVDNSGKPIARCGGWGHLFGDEGSGCDIARRAVQLIYQRKDEFICTKSHSTEMQKSIWYKAKDQEKEGVGKAENAMYKYFEVENRDELIQYMYPPGFDKTFFSGFTTELAKLGRAGDNFSKWIFDEAGQLLASHIIALRKNYDGEKSLLSKLSHSISGKKGSVKAKIIDIVCEGSVWRNWDLMGDGFKRNLRHSLKDCRLIKFRLLRTTTSACIGAARLGAASGNVDISLNFSENSALLDEVLVGK